MREKAIEHKLILTVRRMGGVCPKLVSPGLAGMPDRLVLLPEGCMAFVEVKAQGRKPTALQKTRHKMLRSLGFKVYVLDDESEIERLFDEIQTS